jgi:hypothetical protein
MFTEPQTCSAYTLLCAESCYTIKELGQENFRNPQAASVVRGTALITAALSHRQLASAEASCDGGGVQGSANRKTLQSAMGGYRIV